MAASNPGKERETDRAAAEWRIRAAPEHSLGCQQSHTDAGTNADAERKRKTETQEGPGPGSSVPSGAVLIRAHQCRVCENGGS